LVLVGTFVATLPGLAEPTVLVADAPGRTPAGPTAATRLPTPPPPLPHPARKADSSNPVNQPQVVAALRLQLLIFVSKKLFPPAKQLFPSVVTAFVAHLLKVYCALPYIERKKIRALSGSFPFLGQGNRRDLRHLQTVKPYSGPAFTPGTRMKAILAAKRP
jgi:hypothetical protein